MHFDDLLTRYFGEVDPDSIPAGALEPGLERMKVDFGLERDRGRRFALWALMYILGSSPDLEVAFKEDADRQAARNFMDFADGLPA